MPNCIEVSLIQPAARGYPPLAWQSELGQIAALEGVQTFVRTGDFTTQDAERELHRRATVKLWSGHGVAGGLLMPNGTIRRAQWLATHAKVGLPRVVVLAACYSGLPQEFPVDSPPDTLLRPLTEEISRAGMHAIGFVAEAEDAAVVTFNVALISALATGVPVTAAYDVAREEIIGTITSKRVFHTPPLMDGMADVFLRLEGVEYSQKRTDRNIEKIMKHLGIAPDDEEAATC